MSIANRTSVNYANSFNFYFNISTAVLLTIVGFIGNSLVLFILTRKQFRGVSMFRYYSFVVAFETPEILSIWVLNFPKIFLLTEKAIACKLIQYFSNVLAIFVTWMPPIISIDRYISVKYPNKYLFRNKFNFQLIIIACLLLCSSLTSIPFYYFHNVFSVNNVTQCGYTLNLWSGMIIDISLLVISLFIPISMSITFSCLTAYQLIHKRKKLNVKNFKKEKRLLKVLISMDLFYLICNMPWCVYTILKELFNMEDYFPHTLAVLFDISNFLFYVCQTCNFFVYFFSNKQFRNFFFCENKK